MRPSSVCSSTGTRRPAHSRGGLEQVDCEDGRAGERQSGRGQAREQGEVECEGDRRRREPGNASGRAEQQQCLKETAAAPSTTPRGARSVRRRWKLACRVVYSPGSSRTGSNNHRHTRLSPSARSCSSTREARTPAPRLRRGICSATEPAIVAIARPRGVGNCREAA